VPSVTAPGFGGKPPPPGIKILKFRAWSNPAKTVVGFVDIQLPSGIILNGNKLMRGPAGEPWVAPAAVKQLDKNGEPVLDQRGKAKWQPVVDFASPKVRERFGEAVLTALRASHPEAFDQEGAS
jgi:hypothetical protein